MKVITDNRCTEYFSPGHPERPERISRSVELLNRQNEIPIEWVKPLEPDDQPIERAHHPDYIRLVKTTAVDFDGDTPAYDHIAHHARRSVGGALRALELARQGENAFSLLRPPGHHATADQAMGFCYFNSVAIAVLEAVATGAGKAAVFDFDVHHGNGTEAILLNRSQVAFFSIHQFPCYPGTGGQNAGNNCFNFPVPPQTPRDAYRDMLSRALAAMEKFNPDLVAVSAGFDAYARDPLAQETLQAEDFEWLGRQLRSLNRPLVSVLEGGYSKDLPQLILAYLKGLAG